LGVIFSKATETVIIRLKTTHNNGFHCLGGVAICCALFCQKWTDISVFDWAKSAIEWIGNGM